MPACVEPLHLYRPRNPQASDLWRLLDRHFPAFQQVYDERFQAKYGFWRPVVERSVTAFLACGDLQQGFARVRCPDCQHEMFVAYSCKQRCTCPSCHQKRALLTAMHVAEEVCFPVAHRQVVLTIPKRLRLHTRFDRSLLGKLAAAAWTCVRDEVRRLLRRDDVLPGMVVAIQTHGELLHWHPHIHALVTCGGFRAPSHSDGRQGDFVELPELDKEQLCAAWREAVFALYLAEGKIGPEVVENMRAWPHSGFHADQSVFLPAGDRAGVERLMQYMTRCPFSLSRLVKVTKTGEVVYKAEKDACRAFPDPQRELLASGVKRNFQILSPLDFLAEFTQHIPPKGAHLVRYYGWYSNKSRGLRAKAAAYSSRSAEMSCAEGGHRLAELVDEGLVPADATPGSVLPAPRPARASQTWAMLIKRVYEVDPLCCPQCGSQMKVIAFIEPPQGDVIEKILRHCGLWQPSTARPPPAEEGLVYVPEDDGGEPADDDLPAELAYVAEPDWDRQPPLGEVPWEVTGGAYGDSFDASF
jgi:hypothetical protein